MIYLVIPTSEGGGAEAQFQQFDELDLPVERIVLKELTLYNGKFWIYNPLLFYRLYVKLRAASFVISFVATASIFVGVLNVFIPYKHILRDGGSLLGCKKRGVKEKIRLITAKRAHKIACNNLEMIPYWQDRGHHAFLLPNIVSLPSLKCTKMSGSILYVGRLIEDKGIKELIDWFLKIDNNGFSLCIIGDGPLEAYVQSFSHRNIRHRKYSDRIEEREMAAAEFYVSFSKREGASNTLLKALGLKCIPLISDIPGHRQYFLPEYVYIKEHVYSEKHFNFLRGKKMELERASKKIVNMHTLFTVNEILKSELYS